jgi:uncharacterized protein with PIN domain
MVSTPHRVSSPSHRAHFASGFAKLAVQPGMTRTCPECGAELMPSVRAIKVHVVKTAARAPMPAVQCVDCGRLFPDAHEATTAQAERAAS